MLYLQRGSDFLSEDVGISRLILKIGQTDGYCIGGGTTVVYDL